MRRGIVAAALAALGTLTGRPAFSQCADGSPPPCAARRPAPAARAVPSPEARARRFLLLPFRNVTRGPAQDWLVTGAPLMLGEALGQFRDLEVVSEERLTAARRRLSLHADSMPDAAQLRRLAEETDGWTAVNGNVFATGGQLRITVQALDVPTARVVARGETQVAAEADVREAFDRLCVRLLEGTGVQMSGAPGLTVHSTQSVDAYRAYVRGVDLMQRSGYVRAKAAFSEAVRLDSTFALAWAKLAMASFGADLFSLINPANPALVAVSQAVRTGTRLPPRQARHVRAMQMFFAGRLEPARRLADSLVSTDRDDLDARELLASLEFMNPMLDTTVSPPRPAASLNRAVMLAREVLERDPGRRNVYSVIALVYSATAGLGPGLSFVRGDFPSWAALLQRYLSQGADLVLVPILRDSIVLEPRDAFERRTEAERAALRRPGADAAMDWIERWLAAGPGDAEAHLWASRVAEMRADWPRALRELIVAESLGVESLLDNVPARHVGLLVQSGQLPAAIALADSLVKTGRLARGPTPGFTPGGAYAAAAFLLGKDWTRAASYVTMLGPTLSGASPCLSMTSSITGLGPTPPVPFAVRKAIMDTVVQYYARVATIPALSACVGNLTSTIATDSTSGRRTRAGATLMAVADSLAAAGNTPLAYRAARSAVTVDTARTRSLAERPWFVSLSREFSPGSRFIPGTAAVFADSAVFTFVLADKRPIALTRPDVVVNWAFQVDITTLVSGGAPGRLYRLRAAHSWRERNPAASGGVAEMLAAITGRTAESFPADPSIVASRPEVAATADGFRILVRGPMVSELRRLRPPTAVFSGDPCQAVSDGVCARPAVPIVYR